MPTTTSVPQRVSPEVSTLGPLKRNSPQSGSRGRLTVKNNTSETMKKQIKKIFFLSEKKRKKNTIRRVIHGTALVLPPESKLYVMVRSSTTPAHVFQG